MSAPPSLSILHIGTEKRWRGGENQIRLLIEGSRDRARHLVAYPRNSRGIEVFSGITETFPLSGTNLLADVLGLRRLCRERHIDVIDAHSGNAHTLALLVASRRHGPAVVVHRRVASRVRPGPYARWKYHSRKVTRFVAISRFIERALAAAGVPTERIAVVYSAVPFRRYSSDDRRRARASLLQRLSLPPDCVLIGNASALTKEKGHPVLLRALGRLRRDGGTPFHAVIAGDGPLRADLERQRDALGLANDMTFLGHVDRVDDLLLALDILAMPSEREGLGTLLLDATLAGCALVATDVGGIPEVVHHRATGLLSAAGDDRGLFENLATLARDPELRHTMNEAAKDFVARTFSVEHMVAGNLAVYEDAAAVVNPP